MFVHIFAFQWKPTAKDADKSRALHDIKAFAGRIDGLIDMHVGTNVSPNAPHYSTTGVMMFRDRSAFDAYAVHPQHLALLDWLVPLIDPIELDFTAEE